MDILRNLKRFRRTIRESPHPVPGRPTVTGAAPGGDEQTRALACLPAALDRVPAPPHRPARLTEAGGEGLSCCEVLPSIMFTNTSESSAPPLPAT